METPVRNRNEVHDVNDKIEEVSRKEIQEACLRYVMPDAYSIEHEDLYRAILHVLGMKKSLSTSRRNYLSQAVEELIKGGQLEECDGKIVLGKDQTKE